MSRTEPGEPAEPARSARRSTLRDRARRAIQAEVELVAFGLFVEQGFEQTTIEQISERAGISRSSFFRYFPTKEDVVVGSHAEWGLDILQALEERPDGEHPWIALRAALEPLIAATVADPVSTRQMTKMLQETPALAARHYEKTLQWHAFLVPEVARRLGIAAGDASDPRPKSLVAATIGCLDAATEAWANGDGRSDLRTLLDLAMDSLNGPHPGSCDQAHSSSE